MNSKVVIPEIAKNMLHELNPSNTIISITSSIVKKLIIPLFSLYKQNNINIK